jgi:phosphoesterase RecJ-like protein
VQVSIRLCDEVGSILQGKQTFLLTTASPDGDAVGSMLALAMALVQHEKEAHIYLPEPLPDNLNFLPGKNLLTYSLPPHPVDVLLVLDTGSSKLLFDGNRLLWRKLAGQIINLDHHPDNDRFGDINLVTPQAASTGEIVFRILVHLGWEIDRDMAVCLLTALMSDTGVFRYPNVTSFTYMIASELLSKGINNGEIARNIYASCSPAYVKLLGRMFGNLQLDLDGKLAWSVLSREDFQSANAVEEEADKMVEQLDILKDVKVYALLRETQKGIKVSLRSRDNIPVNRIAAQFGGGGHVQAAGCRLTGDLKEVEKKIVKELKSLFET